MVQEDAQQHPIALYFAIWILLFVLSSFSYAVDYYQLQGLTRWGLVIMFMLLKAGFIVAIFMHMKWERIGFKYAILLPPLALLILIGFMAMEGSYTNEAREVYLGGQETAMKPEHGGHAAAAAEQHN